jgi:hypothetical protein
VITNSDARVPHAPAVAPHTDRAIRTHGYEGGRTTEREGGEPCTDADVVALLNSMSNWVTPTSVLRFVDENATSAFQRSRHACGVSEGLVIGGDVTAAPRSV